MPSNPNLAPRQTLTFFCRRRRAALADTHHLIQVVLEIFDCNGLIRDEIKELSQCHHSTYALLEEEVGDVFTVLACPQAGGGSTSAKRKAAAAVRGQLA